MDRLEKGEAVSLAGVLLTSDDILIERMPLDGRVLATQGGVTVLFDTKLSPELVAEGRTREVVNRIQNLRKDSGLSVSDRIDLQIASSQALIDDVQQFKDYLLKETLGHKVEFLQSEGECKLRFRESYQIDSMTCVIALDTVKV